MPETPLCPDCDETMVEGFIPDASYGQYLQLQWHSGAPRAAKFLGMPAGTKVVRTAMRPVLTYMCPHCGLLRSYAESPDPTKPGQPG
jgi:hypothetical protein